MWCDMNSLYVEIIDKNRTRMHDLWPKIVEETKTRKPLELRSWQRWETTQANHNFECDDKLCFNLIYIKEEYQIRKYKRYQDDLSVPVPKSTRLDRNKRSVTRFNTASYLDSLVCLSSELVEVPTESSASHNGETFSRETEATVCDYRGALELSYANDYAQSEAFPSLERGVENEDTRLSFYTRPTKYKTILLIADSEKNNK